MLTTLADEMARRGAAPSVEAALALDRRALAVKILDIEVAEGAWGWNVALKDKGFLSDMVKTGSFNCAR